MCLMKLSVFSKCRRGRTPFSKIKYLWKWREEPPFFSGRVGKCFKYWVLRWNEYSCPPICLLFRWAKKQTICGNYHIYLQFAHPTCSKKQNVVGGTWTPKDFSTRPSNVRVYRFRHYDILNYQTCSVLRLALNGTAHTPVGSQHFRRVVFRLSQLRCSFLCSACTTTY